MIHTTRWVQDRRTAVMVAVLGTVSVVAYGLLAAVQIMVLNPLAAVPDVGLGQIRADMDAAGETLGAWWVLMAVGPALVIALLVRVGKRPELQPRMVASRYLILLALGTPAYFIASFGPGMALADRYGIGGGDASPWAVPLHVTSMLAVIALAGLAAWNRSRVSRLHR